MKPSSLVYAMWAAALLVAGCDDETPADPTRTLTVLVVDTGFDVSAPVLSQKIVAAYTLTCEDLPGGGLALPDGGAVPVGGAGDAGTNDGGPPAELEALKDEVIAALARPEEDCRLQEGIAPLPDPFADLANQRATWNAAIAKHQLIGNSFQMSKLDQLQAELFRRLANAPFHGTATASLIARENPSVRLVLMERPLGTMEEAVQSITCPTQEELDLTVAVFSDARVRQAYLNRPRPSDERAVWRVASQHGIGVVNESFGPPSRVALERVLAQKMCKPVSLRPYYQTISELERAASEAQAPAGLLVMKSAGNEGQPLLSGADDLSCRIGWDRQLLVGAYNLLHEVASFSNFGPCVDLYAPGQDVVTSLPGGWNVPLDGTSFAAPMAVRALSRLAPRPFAVTTARQALLDAREPSRSLPVRLYSKRFFWDPGNQLQEQRLALTTETDRAPPVKAAAPLEPMALRRALWPLSWVSRAATSGGR